MQDQTRGIKDQKSRKVTNQRRIRYDGENSISDKGQDEIRLSQGNSKIQIKYINLAEKVRKRPLNKFFKSQLVQVCEGKDNMNKYVKLQQYKQGPKGQKFRDVAALNHHTDEVNTMKDKA